LQVETEHLMTFEPQGSDLRHMEQTSPEAEATLMRGGLLSEMGGR
jgi:hypothetical protein